AALLMATLGIYGVISYAVFCLKKKIGTRLALGAMARDVLALVVGGGLKMAAYGIAVGAVAVTAVASLVARYFETLEGGWITFAFATAIVVGISLVASSFPAWCASRLSPIVAI